MHVPATVASSRYASAAPAGVSEGDAEHQKKKKKTKKDNWRVPPLPLRWLLVASCAGPQERCRCCGPRARSSVVALRVVVSMWNSIGTFMLHGKFPILRAWFSLVGGFCYAVAIPVVTVNLHRFFETDGGRVNGHGAALLSSYFSSSTLFWSITMPAWILLVVLAFWSAMALFFIFSQGRRLSLYACPRDAPEISRGP